MPLEPLAIPVTELFTLLAGGHAARVTVVTPNRRLARSLLERFDASREGAGLTAWETADILSIDAYLQRHREEALYSRAAGQVPALLSPAQEQVLWEEAIRSSASGEKLFAPAAAAAQCRQAWRLVQAWRLAGKLAMHPGGEDARAFLDWMGRYVRLARERGVTDEARLADAVIPLLALEDVARPAMLVLFGFDIVTPQQQALFAALAALGTQLRSARFEAAGDSAARLEFDTPDEELEAIARWTRARLEADPAARIGIVVPELERTRPRVERALQRVLQPGRALEAGEGAAPYDFSLGLPLAEWPLAADALGVLRLCGRDVDFEEASRLVRSPFLVAGEEEATLRARLDAALREKATAWISLDALIRLAAGGNVPRAPRLLDALAMLAEHRKAALFGAKGAAEWARGFSAALDKAGFPGERALDSTEYQSLQKWHQLLSEFATLERVAARMSFREALGRLERMARETLFQPESGGGPVQVLGVLESAGRPFDYLWVSALSDEAWPMPARPHPFLPAALQREAGIPHADAATSLELDRRITAGWLAAAAEVVVSHARMLEDSEAEASALVKAIPLADAAGLRVPDYSTVLRAMRGAGRLERLADGRGPAIEAGAHMGGTSLFKNQAACPFRAFAKHRLASKKLEAPRPGLSPGDRGTLLHEMLAAVWARLGSRAKLLQMPEADLGALLAACAEEAVAGLRRKRSDVLSPRFAALERTRLAQATREWLEVERGRADFEVEMVEDKKAVTFGGVTVNTRIDRVDRLSSGGLAVIDYKTGREASIQDWLDERPKDPQLPMYALAGGGDVRAIAFARLRPGRYEFCGLAKEDGLLPKVKAVENGGKHAVKHGDWPRLVAHWQRVIDALGVEFREGIASVRPDDGVKTCKNCDQHAFCRVAEKAPDAWGDEAEEA
jgi:probable DNA repair protein